MPENAEKAANHAAFCLSSFLRFQASLLLIRLALGSQILGHVNYRVWCMRGAIASGVALHTVQEDVV